MKNIYFKQNFDMLNKKENFTFYSYLEPLKLENF